MPDGIDINIFSGRALNIAQNIDKNNAKDNKLSEAEISIFLEECRKDGIDVEKESWYSKCAAFLNDKVLKNTLPSFMQSKMENTAVRDATYVADSPEVAMMKEREKIANKNIVSLNLPAKLSQTSDVRTEYDWSEKEFSKVLDQMLNAPRYKGKFKNSVLQGKAKAFIDSGKKYGIDPRILVAISMCESTRGTSAKATKLNNIGGLKINGKYHHFENVEASIDSIAKTLDTRCSEGYTTPKKIAYSGRYCAKWAASTWLSQVNSYLGFFDKYYKADHTTM